MEVIDHDLGFEPNRVVAALDEAAQLLLGLIDVELRVFLHRLGELVVALHWHVVGEHVEDEPLLDRLLHGVAVEGVMLTLPSACGFGAPKISSVLFLGVAVKAK